MWNLVSYSSANRSRDCCASDIKMSANLVLDDVGLESSIQPSPALWTNEPRAKAGLGHIGVRLRPVDPRLESSCCLLHLSHVIASVTEISTGV